MAFGTLFGGGRIVVGSDTRLSRHMMRQLVFAGLNSVGSSVVDIGLVATPTVGMTVRRIGAAGGIAITASHNPAEWNALKFFGADGTFLTPDNNKALLEIERTGAFRLASLMELGKVDVIDDAIPYHIKTILEQIPTEVISRRKLRVVVDAVNGVGHLMLSPLFDHLGIHSQWIFTDTNQAFPHNPEPLPENLTALGTSVRENHADLGFAVDPDADRLAIIDELGRPIGEERTLPLAVKGVLEGGLRGPIVANLSTSMAIDRVAEQFNLPVHRTPIGEAHVVGKMTSVGALIGGEGNGGVIFPRVHPGRDAATAATLVLMALASAPEGTTMSKLNSQIPDFFLVKTKFEIEGMDLEAIKARMKTAFADADSVITEDGVKATYKDQWVHLRPSGTEPVIRVFAEASDHLAAQALVQRVRANVLQNEAPR
jgi:phosphomannomutase